MAQDSSRFRTSPVLRTAEGAAAAIGRVDGVPFPAFLLGQIAIQLMEIQMEELLAITHLRLRCRRFLLPCRRFSHGRRGIFFHNSFFDFCGGFRIGWRALPYGGFLRKAYGHIRIIIGRFFCIFRCFR